MSYKIDVQRENGVFISTFGSEMLRSDEFDRYLHDVVDVNLMFDSQGRTQIYHILLVEPNRIDFEGMMRAVNTIRQNKEMVELRKRLNSQTMIVTTSPVIVQFIETILANSSGRRMGVFPTLETALAFIRFDQSQLPDTPPPTSESSSPNADKSPAP